MYTDSNGNLQIPASDITRFITEGVKDGIRSQLNSSYSGLSDMFRKAVGESLNVLGPQIQAAVTECAKVALKSPQLQAAIQKAIIDSVVDKFQGQFDGVIRAAAKQAANSALMTQAIAEAMAKQSK